MTEDFQEIPLAACSLLLYKRQELLNNQLARVPSTLNQEGTREMREEVFSSVGAQDTDKSAYQVYDLEDIDFHLIDPHLNMDAVFRPGKDIPFSPSNFEGFEMGSMAENPFLIDEEQEKESFFPPLLTTPVSERPIHSPVPPLQNGN